MLLVVHHPSLPPVATPDGPGMTAGRQASLHDRRHYPVRLVGGSAGDRHLYRFHEEMHRIPRVLPTVADGLALRITRHRLDSDHGPLVELVDGPGAGIREGGPDTGNDPVYEVLHSGRLRIEIHLGL